MLLCRGERICVGAGVRFFGGRLVDTRSRSTSEASSGQVGREHFRSIDRAVMASAVGAAPDLPRWLRGNGRFALAGN